MIGPIPVPSNRTTRTSRPSVGMARAITHTDNEERTTAGVTNENAERDGDSRGNPDRGSGISELLKQQIPNPSRAFPVGRIGQIGKNVHAVRRFLNQGSVARCPGRAGQRPVLPGATRRAAPRSTPSRGCAPPFARMSTLARALARAGLASASTRPATWPGQVVSERPRALAQLAAIAPDADQSRRPARRPGRGRAGPGVPAAPIRVLRPTRAGAGCDAQSGVGAIRLGVLFGTARAYRRGCGPIGSRRCAMCRRRSNSAGAPCAAATSGAARSSGEEPDETRARALVAATLALLFGWGAS